MRIVCHVTSFIDIAYSINDIPIRLFRVDGFTFAKVPEKNFGLTTMRKPIGCFSVFKDRRELPRLKYVLRITLQGLGEGLSEVRNRIIVKIFREAGYVEQLGTGIKRVKETCRTKALPEP